METKKENSGAKNPLEETKMQYDKMQEKFSKRDIVNNKPFEEEIDKQTARFRRKRIFIAASYLIGTVISIYVLQSAMQLSPWISVSLALILIASLIVELNLYGNFINKVKTDNDILTFAKETRRMQRNYILFYLAVSILLVLWVILLIMNMDSYFANEEYCRSIKQRALFIGLPVFLLIVGYIVYKMRNLSKTSMIINQIEKQPLILNRKVLAFGIVTFCIYLLGLIFKIFHIPFGSLIVIAGTLMSVVLVIVIASMLAHNETPKILAALGALFVIFLLLSIHFLISHWPFSEVLLAVSGILLASATISYFVKRRKA